MLLINTVCLEPNELLKLKFKKLQRTIVSGVNPPSIVDFLFQEEVIGDDDMRTLQKSKDDPQQQCRDLLTILHASGNPQAFVQLYAAIKEEPHLKWLIERIDQFTDQSVTDLLKQLDINKATGEYERKCEFRYLGLRLYFCIYYTAHWQSVTAVQVRHVCPRSHSGCRPYL